MLRNILDNFYIFWNFILINRSNTISIQQKIVKETQFNSTQSGCLRLVFDRLIQFRNCSSFQSLNDDFYVFPVLIVSFRTFYTLYPPFNLKEIAILNLALLALTDAASCCPYLVFFVPFQFDQVKSQSDRTQRVTLVQNIKILVQPIRRGCLL